MGIGEWRLWGDGWRLEIGDWRLGIELQRLEIGGGRWEFMAVAGEVGCQRFRDEGGSSELGDGSLKLVADQSSESGV